MWTIYRKELADHFSSVRFVLLLGLIVMVSLITSYLVGVSIKESLIGGAIPKFVFLQMFIQGDFFSLVQFIAFFGPLIGLVLGFDAINRERGTGTLSKLISQPIYRDAVINGKFLAGMTTIAIMLTALVMMLTGMGLIVLGVVPGFEEIARLLAYLVISVFYVSFWLGISILCSILFRSTASSALTALALWIFFGFFIGFGAAIIGGAVAPVDNPNNLDQVVFKAQVTKAISMVSPGRLYSEATTALLDPFRNTTKSLVLMGQMEQISMSRFKNPLPLGQSILVVVPYIAILLAITIVCFGISYMVFMRQEIRSA
jgi:ABC-2 type transport system permease protein